MIEQAVILCGGKGTRLGNLTRDVPKPLLPVAGRVLLDRTIERLARAGIKRALMMAGHLGEQIAEHYSDGSFMGVEIEVFLEPEPLGTSGGLLLVEDRLDEDFLLVYGDVFVDFDFARLMRHHKEQVASQKDVLATLLVRASDHPWDSHLVDVDDDGKVREFIHKQEEGRLYKNCGNVAIYCCRKGLLKSIPVGQSSDFGRDVFPAVLSAGGDLRALGLEAGGFVRDMGTPDRLELVEQYLERRARSREAEENPKPLKVAFLDRDGTLNREVGLISKPEQIEMLPGAAAAVARLCDAGWRCFIITNQPVIARGLADVPTLDAINGVVIGAIEEAGGKIEQLYYSPFHPETHHGDGVKELRRASDCRKPGAGMLYHAAEDHGLDLAEVVMVGDTWRDILAGQIAGVRTCYLGAEAEGADLGASHTANDLAGAVDFLLSSHSL